MKQCAPNYWSQVLDESLISLLNIQSLKSLTTNTKKKSWNIERFKREQKEKKNPFKKNNKIVNLGIQFQGACFIHDIKIVYLKQDL